MRNKNLKILSIKENRGWVTNVDILDLKETFALRTRGFLHFTPGIIGMRDNGTKHLFGVADPYPDKPTAITFVDGFMMYDPITAQEHLILVGLDTANNMRLYVRDGNTWIELTKRIRADVNGTPPIAQLSVAIKNIIDDANTVVVPNLNEFRDWVVINTTRSQATIVTDNSATSITTESRLGSDGLGWQDGDDLSFYRFYAIYDVFNLNNGLTPHIRWLAVETQRKILFFYGDSSLPTVTRQPLSISKKSARNYFDKGVLFGYTLPSGFYVEKSGGLIPHFVQIGEPSNDNTGKIKRPADAIVPAIIDDGTDTNWLEIQYLIQHENPPTGQSFTELQRWYITVLYDTGAESDPIYQLHCAPTFEQAGNPKVKFQFLINFAAMNKNISGFNIYIARMLLEDLPNKAVIEWVDSAAEYQLVYTLNVQGEQDSPSWSETSTEPNGRIYNIEIPSATTRFDRAYLENKLPTVGVQKLLSNLNHAPKRTRSYLKPRYATRVAQDFGSIVAVDQDDRTLRLCNINGAQVLEDENYPDVNKNNANAPLKIYLIGKGELLGLSSLRGYVLAFHPTELDFADIIAGTPRLIYVDGTAKRSILETPYGVVWAGTSGIWLLPADGAGVELLNLDFLNHYDGTRFTDDGVTPFMIDSYRNGIITGYNPFYREVWFHTQVTKQDGSGTEYVALRYNFQYQRWIGERKLGIGTSGNEPVKFFTVNKAGLFLIGYDKGVLKYPNLDNDKPFEDDVKQDGSSNNRGIETILRLNIGSLFGIYKNFKLKELFIIKDGKSVDGLGKFQLKPFVNRRTSALDTYNISIDDGHHPIMMPEFGTLEQLGLEISLPSTGLTNFKDFDISQIDLGVLLDVRKGNN